jgi:uncharacterized protein YkwD
MKLNIPYTIARGLLTVALALSLLLSISNQARSQAENYTNDIPLQVADKILQQKACEFWAQINAARRNPLATARRLGVPEDVVRSAFTGQEWILEQGLPPLAWSGALALSASAHSADMFARRYYSYVTPENATYWDRIEATGYEPADAGESMNALFFKNLVELDTAFTLLLEATLRDELTGNPSVERNIFSPEFTDVGISFTAGNALIVDDQPYVYLFLADFARQRQPQRPRIIGTYPAGHAIVVHPLDGGWYQLHQLQEVAEPPAGTYQITLPAGGADLILIDNYGMGYVADIAVLRDIPSNDADEAGYTFNNPNILHNFTPAER